MIGEADYGMTEAAFKADEGNARYLGDAKLYVVFFLHPREDKAKTAEMGRPMYKDEEYVRIMVPGDKDNVIIRPARDLDKQRFVKQYTAFKAGEGEITEGTPLKAWPMMTRGEVEEMKYFGVFTVEQLADLADVHVGKFMALGKKKEQAKAFLQAAKDTAPLTQLNAAVEQKDAEIAALMQAVEDLKGKVTDLEKVGKKEKKAA